MNDDRSPDDDDERTPLTHTVVPADEAAGPDPWPPPTGPDDLSGSVPPDPPPTVPDDKTAEPIDPDPPEPWPPIGSDDVTIAPNPVTLMGEIIYGSDGLDEMVIFF